MDVAASLRKRGIQARKDLGQHFLKDQSVVRRIVDTSGVAGKTIVEIGPGPGVLTKALVEQAKQVIAVELDENLVRILKEDLSAENLEVRQGDVLKTDPADFPKPYEVVANVPYYITSAILRHFLESDHRPAAMTVTIQAEVAERIVAEPPKMSVLAVSVQLYGRLQIVAKVSKGAFWPPPEVDSAILRIEDIGKDLGTTLGDLPEQTFFKVVRAGFAEKRKQLHNTLAHNLALTPEQTAAILTQAGIDAARRAETLTVPDWVRLGAAYAET